MEPISREFYKQCSFQKYCNAVLHNEACDAHRELRTHKAKEVTFSDMTLDEARQLHTLPEEKRKAILLYYFEGMSDTEIAELLNTPRSTIQYRRTSSFEQLRKYLEENADEWDEW